MGQKCLQLVAFYSPATIGNNMTQKINNLIVSIMVMIFCFNINTNVYE